MGSNFGMHIDLVNAESTLTRLEAENVRLKERLASIAEALGCDESFLRKPLADMLTEGAKNMHTLREERDQLRQRAESAEAALKEMQKK